MAHLRRLDFRQERQLGQIQVVHRSHQQHAWRLIARTQVGLDGDMRVGTPNFSSHMRQQREFSFPQPSLQVYVERAPSVSF